MSAGASSGLAVALSGVRHRYRGAAAPSLSDVDLTVRRGERVAVIGPSGGGKTTLLTLLDGRLRGWRGAAATLDFALDAGHPPPRALRRRVGFVFQEFALIERASVYQNALNGRLGAAPPITSLFGRFSEQDHEAAEAALRAAGVDDLAGRRADRLSGGQRQRVAIARCLAQNPELILADEPVSNLDPTRAEQVLGLLSGAARERGATLVFTSHQPALAIAFADRFVALRGGAVAFDGAGGDLDSGRLAELYDGEPLAAGSLRLVG